MCSAVPVFLSATAAASVFSVHDLGATSHIGKCSKALGFD